MSFSIILLIIASVLLVVAFVLTIKPMWVAAVPAWAAMMLLYWGEYILPVTLPTWKIAMWTMATAIVVLLRRYQPAGEPDGRNTGNLYIGLASVVGALLGIAMGANYVLLCTIVGAAVGLMAYSRTPHALRLPDGTARCAPGCRKPSYRSRPSPCRAGKNA